MDVSANLIKHIEKIRHAFAVAGVAGELDDAIAVLKHLDSSLIRDDGIGSLLDDCYEILAPMSEQADKVGLQEDRAASTETPLRLDDETVRATCAKLVKKVYLMRDLGFMQRLEKSDQRVDHLERTLRLRDDFVVEAQGTQQLMLDFMRSMSERLGRMETAIKESSKPPVVPVQKPNCFPFIIPPHPSRIVQGSALPSPVAAQVIVDSGSDENWISRETVARAGLEADIIPAKDGEHHYAHFGDTMFMPQGSIEITWYSDNQALAKRSKFWVHDQVPFNALLGMAFIVGGNDAMFAEPVLALRQMRLDPNDLRRIGEAAQEKSTANKDVAAMRRAEAAAARERTRQTRESARATAAPDAGQSWPLSTEGEASRAQGLEEAAGDGYRQVSGRQMSGRDASTPRSVVDEYDMIRQLPQESATMTNAAPLESLAEEDASAQTPERLVVAAGSDGNPVLVGE